MKHSHRRQFKRLKTEMGLLIPLALPILTAQLSQQAISFIDTVMAGRVSAADLAGVAIGSSIWIPLFLFLYGVMLALAPMVAQLHGAGKTAETGPLARRGMVAMLPLVVVTMLLLRHTSVIFAHMGVDPHVAAISANYLKAISWGVPAIAIFFLLRNLSEGLALVRPSMVIGLASIPFNAACNYAFIYGKLGLPAMGGIGCGWASALTFWFMSGGMLLTIWRIRRYNMTHFFDFTQKCAIDGAVQLLRLGVPIGLALLVEASIFALIALFLAPLGASTVASHQITLNYSAMIFMIPLSVSYAITIRVGHAIGRQRHDRAALACKAGIVLNLAVALVTATLTLFFAEHIAAIYTRDPHVIAVAVGLLYFNAFYQISDAIQVGAAGSLRGYKDTRVPLVMVIIAYWVIALPLGYSLALTDFWGVQLGAKGFWISLIIGLSIAAILLTLRLRRVIHTQTSG